MARTLGAKGYHEVTTGVHATRRYEAVWSEWTERDETVRDTSVEDGVA